jgi:hypothetical protein
MAGKLKRHSMTESLKGREDVRAFLDAGKSSSRNEDAPKARPMAEPAEKRIAVTLRLPERIAHALIDASANRRKKREGAWSQQRITERELLSFRR